MNGKRSKFWMAALFAAVGLSATQAFAQAPDPAKAEDALRRAIAAEARAAETGKIADREAVARLFIESANFRAYDDPTAVVNLRNAAMYLSFSRPAESAELLSKAAERALAQGNVVAAANLFVDAAVALTIPQDYSVTPSQYEQVQRWLIRASMLAESPLIQPSDRDLILRRMSPVEIGNYAG